MRYILYSLGLKHRLPQFVASVAQGEQVYVNNFYRYVIPVGTALISADENDATLYLIHLVEAPENILYRSIFAQIPPVDRNSFLHMLELANRVSSITCMKQESITLTGDVFDLIDYQREAIDAAYFKAIGTLVTDLYSRN